MSGNIYMQPNSQAQGSSQLGWGISCEQGTYGTEPTANSAVSDTPANILLIQAKAPYTGANLGGLQAPTK